MAAQVSVISKEAKISFTCNLIYYVETERKACAAAHNAWRDSVTYVTGLRLPHLLSRVSFFMLIRKWTPKFTKLEMYNLQGAYVSF
jgi:hypothetical protein